MLQINKKQLRSFLIKHPFLTSGICALLVGVFTFVVSAKLLETTVYGRGRLLRSASNNLHAKIDQLADAIVRVKRYEDQLRLRTRALDLVLHETRDLELKEESTKEKRSAATHLGKGGIGGGPETQAPIMHSKTGAAITKQSWADYRSNDLLSRLDWQIGTLKMLPVGAPVTGEITSIYGRRISPNSFRSQFHEGIDLAVEKRTPITCPADGVVVSASYKGAYGNSIIVDHGNGIETLYGHLSSMSVHEGQKVCRGQLLGLVGSTGNSTGPHLHYEVRVNGTAKDPMPFIDLAKTLQVVS